MLVLVIIITVYRQHQDTNQILQSFEFGVCLSALTIERVHMLMLTPSNRPRSNAQSS